MKAFYEQKQCDLHTRWRPSSYGESNPVVVQEKRPEFYQKRCMASNSPDLNPIESPWSIFDEAAYIQSVAKVFGTPDLSRT